MLGILALCTVAGYFFWWLGFNVNNIIMIYILGVLAVSMATTGRSYSLVSSLLSVLIFNFFFTHPYFTLMSDPGYLVTFGIMFIVALLVSSLTTRIKGQAILSANKAYRTEILLETSRKLQTAEGPDAILSVTAAQLSKLLERNLLLYPLQENGTLGSAMCFPSSSAADMSPYLTHEEQAVAEWVRKNNKHAGATTNTLPSSKCLYMAVRGSKQVLAVAGVAIDPSHAPDAFEKNLMVAILDECGLALEKRTNGPCQTAGGRNSPSGSPAGQPSARHFSRPAHAPDQYFRQRRHPDGKRRRTLRQQKKALYASIYDDSMWLINLVENLLSITRMENGSIKLNIHPELLDEVFAEALAHLDRNAGQHQISVELKDDLIMADMDARLIVQVVINIVNNAIKYTPEGSRILVSAERQGAWVQVRIADDGPGIPAEAQEKLFDMFYTANNARGDGRRGLGLGLSLCRSIVTAHGGTIAALDNPPHGTAFVFTLHSFGGNAL